MQNFQDNFETCKWSFISAFSICMTVPLRTVFKHYLSSASKYIPLYNSNYPCSIYLFKFFNFVLNLFFFFFFDPKKYLFKLCFYPRSQSTVTTLSSLVYYKPYNSENDLTWFYMTLWSVGHMTLWMMASKLQSYQLY